MANLTSAINIQVDSDTKKQATDILNNLGLSMSTAINIFLKQVIKRDGIPFEIVNNKPNEEMLKAVQEVKEMISQSEVYVFEADKKIQGFVGLNDEYIEGIFVSDEMQSCGIGKLLLDYIKDKKVSLRLNVYQKNARAISFYQREGFIIQCEGLDEATGEKEYTMLWKRK